MTNYNNKIEKFSKANLLADNEYLHSELMWLSAVISIRTNNQEVIPEAPKVKVIDEESHFAQFILKHQLDTYERLLLILTIAPNVLPSIFKNLFSENHIPKPIQFREGGAISKLGRSFIPTIETFFYLACDNNIEERLDLLKRFNKEHFLFNMRILELDDKESTNTSFLNKTIHLSSEFYHKLILQKPYHPDFNNEFPAKEISTSLEWSDLILAPSTKTRLQELLNWLKFKNELYQSEFGKHLKPGYRVLFYGSPGTGKSLTASLLGKLTGIPVFRIDLSKVVSKFIGETEKNLARVFDKAENANWILFFDEADALFGSRTTTSNSNDRYANQEVSYVRLQTKVDFFLVGVSG